MKNIFFAFFIFFLTSFAGSAQSTEISYSGLDSKGVPFDRKLVQLMNYKNGIFVEVGANDGIQQSNTKLFEDSYDWTGVLIEPSEAIFERLCNNRPNSKCFQCALGSFSENNTYIYGDFDGGLMSSIGGTREHKAPTQLVLVRSLQSILDEAQISHVNFFSLDVEGYEYHILQGIDYTKTQFDYILIEIYSRQYRKIVPYLLKRGYALAGNFSHYNLLDNRGWDGTHNDYLFKNINLK